MGNKMNRYGAPTTYNRITPHRGCGFILERIWDLTEDTTKTCPPSLPAGPHPTRQDIYRGTKWANRPGFASLLWSSLIKDGLIESDDGMQEYKYYSFCIRSHIGMRAAGHYEAGNGYTVRYHLTPKGRGILIDMMERRVLQKANKMASGRTLNTVGSVAEYDAKKDWAPKVEDWRDDDFLEPGETKDEWMARHGVTPIKAPPTPVERDILQKEALDCAKLAADYAGENQKLRAEKEDLNTRLKNLAERLKNLESEIVNTRFTLNSLIDWDK